jgi:CubicO group peptidase (beta-lactamase class C family)
MSPRGRTIAGWDAVAALLEQGAAEGGADAAGTFPGAVALVARGGDVLFEQAVGVTRRVPTPGTAVTAETWFDLASLSKPMATGAIALALAASGRLDLDAPVARYRPAFAAGPAGQGARSGSDARRAVRVRDLLTHASGLPAWAPLHEQLRDAAAPREAAVRLVDATPLDTPPGARALYSDLGFLTLGAVVESAGGAPLETLFERHVRELLGLDEVGFAPLGGPAPWAAGASVAATEDSPWRSGVLQGQVHDDTAWAMGGVAGHAGLFGTARGVHRFCARWLALREGSAGPVPRALVEETFRRQGAPGTTRTLGWDTPSPDASSAGTRLSRDSIGHLGYSGTSMWIDPGRRLIAVLLTNRVHPTRENKRIQAFRPRFHDLVAAAADRA